MDSTTGPDTSAAQSSDRLDSWKEIAAFLGRGVTTVQRWEEEEGLPVHRHAHAKRGTVFAFKSELETWRSSRDQLPDNSDPAAKANDAPESAEREHMRVGAVEPPASSLSLLRLLPLAAIALLAIVGLGMVLARTVSKTDAINDDMPRPLANDAAYEGYPSLSPDGLFVAFRWSHEDAPGIYVKSTGGGAAWVLNLDGPPAANRDSFPKWSPDGRSIAFLREIGSSVWDVRVAPATGGTSRRVTQITSASVSWMPDGKTLAVVDRPAPGEPYSVFLVAIENGQRLRRVTSPPPGTFGDWHCAVSPDGTRLAVARFQSGYHADIYVTALQSGEASMTRITRDSVGLGHLEWTPDGRSLVFASLREDRAAVWTVSAAPAADETPRLIAGAEGGAQHPTVARTFDGDTLKLAFQHESSVVALWRWDLGATPRPEPRMLAATSTAADRQPSWSPDGTQIAFSSDRSGHSELWVADADGGNAHQLTFQGGVGVLQPRWSPNGRWILFTATRDGQQDIEKIRTDGTEPVRMTFDPTDERNGSWSRDGEWIYFRSNRGGGPVRVWKADANRRTEPVPATVAESSEAIESLDGRTLYFTKHDDAGVWQKPLPDGPETLLVPDWHAREGFWDVIRDGLLMVDKQVPGSRGNQPVTVYSFASGSLVPYAALPVMVARMQDGISARPDGSLLWAQKELRYSDVMLFERWRPRNTP